MKDKSAKFAQKYYKYFDLIMLFYCKKLLKNVLSLHVCPQITTIQINSLADHRQKRYSKIYLTNYDDKT